LVPCAYLACYANDESLTQPFNIRGFVLKRREGSESRAS